jgi:hypothetical protein
MQLATYFHLAPRFRISEAIPPFPHTPSWHIHRKLYLTFIVTRNRHLFAHQQINITKKHSFIHQQVDIYQQNGTSTFCTQQGTLFVKYFMRIGSKGLSTATLIKHDGVTVKDIMLPEQNCD